MSEPRAGSDARREANDAPGPPTSERAEAPVADPEGRATSPSGAGGHRARGSDAARSALAQVATLVFAAALALGIRILVIEPFRIPSGSMYPTLLVGDHLFVNKFVYGAKLPFLDVRLPAVRAPERGDVVVFTVAHDGFETFPVDERPDLPREQFVKRIVGLPGDRVDFDGDAVLIDGEPMETAFLDTGFEDESGHTLDIHAVRVEGREFRVLHDPRSPGPGNAAIDVPAGRYFVMGDNRDHSKDSRVWGTVRLEEMRGPAFVLYWSWDWKGSWRQLLSPLLWWDLLSDRMRWERIGEWIH